MPLRTIEGTIEREITNHKISKPKRARNILQNIFGKREYEKAYAPALNTNAWLESTRTRTWLPASIELSPGIRA